MAILKYRTYFKQLWRDVYRNGGSPRKACFVYPLDDNCKLDVGTAYSARPKHKGAHGVPWKIVVEWRSAGRIPWDGHRKEAHR